MVTWPPLVSDRDLIVTSPHQPVPFFTFVFDRGGIWSSVGADGYLSLVPVPFGGSEPQCPHGSLCPVLH